MGISFSSKDDIMEKTLEEAMDSWAQTQEEVYLVRNVWTLAYRG